jgi:site-specific DNA recombinase
MTQEIQECSTGNLIRRVIGIFDEYQSEETAKHVSRSMQENSRQGFWNGGIPPFGYRSVEAERRGQKIKKKLDIDDEEAIIVRNVYDFALGRGGAPLGVRAIVNRLNQTGYRFRGKPFHISNVYKY